MTGLALTLAGFAGYFSKFFVAISVVGLYFSVKAFQKAKRNPEHYGGRKIAMTGVALSTAMLMLVATLVGFEIPRWWRAHQVREEMASKAVMWEFCIALGKYKEKHGGLPLQMADLQREGFLSKPALDYWEGHLVYTPTGQLAAADVGRSRASVPVFTQYTLVSPGPDGVLKTRDDLILNDGIFISPDASYIKADE